ncbi:MAG: DUF2723 domain-containing protein [Nanoarchaeota archaeon]|nr:DUF2723 domain-containing protein [Nanoarchaeota archaeon]MBU1631737.1 DUF2723 domain-containing protein [Nanoarchaeota archaeon]MBU1875541.1 DUF2723 domain-containing protein [Nanoarchaeota archaeon]
MIDKMIDKNNLPLSKNNYFIGFLTFLISFFVYLKTLAPTIYWGDSGELITAAYTLGIPHPSGYPTYILLGKLFTFIPFGNIAWRVNLMSAVFASLAVMLLYFICYKLTKSKLASFTASLIFAFTRIFWSQAVIAEVYTLNAFFITLNILILLHWKEKQNNIKNNINTSSKKWLYLFSFAYGLSLTNHITSIFLFPGFAYFILVKEHRGLFKIKWNKDVLKFKIIGICLLLFFVGLLPYAYLPIRSAMNPVWDWGNPQTAQNFIEHLSGKQYNGLVIPFTERELIYNKLASSFKILTENYKTKTFVFLFFSLLGGIYLFRKNKIFFLTLIAIFTLYFLHSLIYIIPDIGVYYIPNILIISIFFSFGVIFFIKKTTERISQCKLKILITFVLIPIFLTLPIIYAIDNYHDNDKSSYYMASDFSYNVLNSMENNSILVFDLHEGNSFPIIYTIEVEKAKKVDVIIINLLGADWYQEKIGSEFNLKKISWNSKINNPRLPELERKEIDQKLQNFKDEIITKNIGLKPIYFFSNNPIKTENYSFFDQGLVYRVIEKNNKTQFDYNQSFNLIIGEKNDDPLSQSILRKYAEIFQRKGIKAIKTKNYDEAIDYFNKAIQIDNYFFEAHYNLAAAHYYKGNYSQSIIYIKNAYQLNPDDKDLRTLLNLIREKLNKKS